MRNSSKSSTGSSNDNDGFVIRLNDNYIGYIVIKGRLSDADRVALCDPTTMSRAIAKSVLTPFDETETSGGGSSILSGL